MRAKQRAREAQRTVCRHLVALHAVLAGQAGDAGFLVDLGGDGVFRVTEDALEFGVEALALWLCEKLSMFIVCDCDGRIPSLGPAAWRNSCVCPRIVSLEFSGERDMEDDIPCLSVFACEGVVEDNEKSAFDRQLLVSGRKKEGRH
jgi:hypothetical protein